MTQIATPGDVSVRRIRAALGISRDRMGRLIDLTSKTIARLEESDRLPANAASATRLSQIQEIIALGLAVLTPDGFRRFMATPFPAFRGLSALQLIERGETEPVFGALAALYEGVPA